MTTRHRRLVDLENNRADTADRAQQFRDCMSYARGCSIDRDPRELDAPLLDHCVRYPESMMAMQATIDAAALDAGDEPINAPTMDPDEFAAVSGMRHGRSLMVETRLTPGEE